MFGPLDHPVGDSSSQGAAQRTGVCRPIYGLCIGVQAGLGPCRPGSSRLASLLDIFPCLVLPYIGTAIHWHCHTLVLPYHGTAIPWYCHTLVLPYHGTVIPWYCHTMVLPYLGTAIPWYCHTLVPGINKRHLWVGSLWRLGEA